MAEKGLKERGEMAQEGFISLHKCLLRDRLSAQTCCSLGLDLVTLCARVRN